MRDKRKDSRAAVRQLLVFDHLDRVAAPILASIAERVKEAQPGLLGVRLAFDKEVAPSLQDNPAWRAARSELLSSLVAHVSHNSLLLGLEIPRMPLPAMYCNSLAAALRSGKGDITGPRKLQFLRMDGCRLCLGSVSALVPALIACVELRLLDLSGCGLRADAAKPLAALLQGHSGRRTAEQARVENERWFSSLRTREAEMPEVPAPPRGLETLILRDNELRNRGAATLGAALLTLAPTVTLWRNPNPLLWKNPSPSPSPSPDPNLHPPLPGGGHAFATLPTRAPVEDERGVGAHEVRDVPPLREPATAAAPRVHLHAGDARVVERACKDDAVG